MEHKPHDIENLISRHLDGELSEDEELELNRELIRDPDAHRLMEECQNLDALAAAALDRAVPKQRTSLDPTALAAGRNMRRMPRYHRGWWLIPGAIAAALLAIAVNRTTLPGGVETGPMQPIVAEGPIPRVGSEQPWNNADSVMRRVNDVPVPRRKVTRNVARNAYGIIGNDGRIYWIEVDRVRTIKRPNAKSSYRPVSEVY